jgi:hypothetical protein
MDFFADVLKENEIEQNVVDAIIRAMNTDAFRGDYLKF